jgi:hypothetical protein
VYGDKAYDNRNNFNILDNKINAEPAIKIRKNASVRSKGCPLRREEMRSYLSGNWDMMWMEEGFERCR